MSSPQLHACPGTIGQKAKSSPHDTTEKRISQAPPLECNSCPLLPDAPDRTFVRVKQSIARVAVGNIELPDPFGESHMTATLPPSKSVIGVAGVVLFVSIALLLLL